MKNLKKKVALLLALVMMLSLVPMNVFGAAHGEVKSSPLPFLADSVVDRGIDFEFPVGILNLATAPHVNIAGVSVAAIQLEIWTNGANRAFMPLEDPVTNVPLYEEGDVEIKDWVGITAANVSEVKAGYTRILVDLVQKEYDVDEDEAAFRVPLRIVHQDATLSARLIINGNLSFTLFDGFALTTGRVAPPGAADRTGVVIGRGDITNFNTLRTGQAIAPIVLTERQIGELARGGGAEFAATSPRAVQLVAPAGYRWVDKAPTATGSGGFTATSAVSGTVTLPNAAGEADGILQFSFAVPTRAANTLVGVVTLAGMELIPRQGHVLVAEDLNVSITVGNISGEPAAFAAITRENANRWTGSVQVARQQLAGLTLGVRGDVPTLASGTKNSDWIATTLLITETGAGSFMNTPLVLSIDHPGVEIEAVRRVNYNEGDRPGDPGWTDTGITRLDDRTFMILHGESGTSARRVVELRLQLRIKPNFAGNFSSDEIVARVTSQGMFPLDSTEVIAKVADPITVTAGEAVKFELPPGLIGVVVNQALAPVTVGATAQGRFTVGNHIHVYLYSVVGGTAFEQPFGNITWAPVATATGMTLGARTPLTNLPDDAIAGFSYRINAVSGDMDARSVSFTNRINGSIFNQAGLELVLAVGGNAAGRDVEADYTVVIGALGQPETPAQPPAEGPAEGPVQPPAPPAGPPTVAVNARALASNGAPAIEVVGGSQFINLRYMMEEVLNGMVDSTRAADGTRLALFSAPHAEGPIVNITIEGAYPNARVIAMVGLTPIPVAARVIDGSWYVNVQAFAQLFGFMPEVN